MSSPPAVNFTSPSGGQNPLFLQGTPSASGTPSRRNLGLSSPLASRHRGTPLFNAGTSSPIALPSSSPRKSQRTIHFQSDPLNSDALEFPVSPQATPTAPKSRRGDIHSSLSITPLASARRIRTTKPINSDLSSEIGTRDVSTSSAHMSAIPMGSDEPDEIRAIWGTTVNLAETMKLFREFLRGFKIKYRVAYNRDVGLSSPPITVEEGEICVYEDYLRQLRRSGETNLNLDVINILAYPPCKKLHHQLLKYPQEVIPAMDQVLKGMMLEIADIDQQNETRGMEGSSGDEEIADIMGKIYKVRPYGVPSVNMRDLNPTDTDKLVCIRGLVIRATPVIPDMKVAFFRCLRCSHTVQVEIDRGKIEEPSRCPRDVCGSIATMTLIHNRCEFADRQVIRLQETPDVVPDGQTPHTVSLSVYDELVDVSKPGDKIVVTGIFRSVPVRVNPRQRTMKSLFKTYLDVVHLRIGASGSLALDRSTRITGDRIPGVGGLGDGTDMDNGYVPAKKSSKTEQEQKLRDLSTRLDIYSLLSRSLAPSIWEMEDIKKGVLLQLFGGTNKSIARGGGGGGPRYRGDINVLLVGDPGTSKSQMLQYVHKIAPRGVYTSGKSSSAVGLTAYVTRDPDSKQLVLESGALVLSDGGICCIDEFDKMSDSTRSVLHEVMEQQTVSVAKAGIITTLNARTSILAAANPVGSKYDVDLPITRNIDLPPTLISRFDLLYLVLDQVDETLDRKLAQHLVGLYLEDAPVTGTDREILSVEELSSYIDYARNKIHPVLTEEAGRELVKSYVKMRDVGQDARNNEKRITATTRQLESMIRLSEAHARMRFCDLVEVRDVTEAYRLMREAIRTSAMDPRTGKIDMSLLNSGEGDGQLKLREDMGKGILGIISTIREDRGMRWKDVITQLGQQSSIKVDAHEFSEVVKRLETEGLLKVIGEKDKRVIRKMEA